jgi:hypothetical protein
MNFKVLLQERHRVKSVLGAGPMNQIEGKLTDFKQRIDGWTPENGFKPSQIDFSPQDIIFGRRIASSVLRHGCCTHPQAVIDDIRSETELDSSFAGWFVTMHPERLQTLCEFLIYRKPPEQ